MKIYVVGGCQSIPIAQCLAIMSAGIPVKRRYTGSDLGAFVTPDDIVFRQRENLAMTSARPPRDELR